MFVIPSFENLDQYSLESLEAMIASGVREGRRIDYKVDWYPSDKIREWSKDISSFANTEGGCIIIGVGCSESSESPEVVGVAGEIELKIRGMVDSVRAQVVPRLLLKHRIFQMPSGRSVVVFATPRSRMGPHAIFRDQSCRIYQRIGEQSVAMDYVEMQRAFRSGRDVMEEIRARHASAALELQRDSRHIVFVFDYYPLDVGELSVAIESPARQAEWQDLFSRAEPWYLQAGVIRFDGWEMARDGAKVKILRDGSLQSHWAFDKKMICKESGVVSMPPVELAEAMRDAWAIFHKCLAQEPLRGEGCLCLTVLGCNGVEISKRLANAQDAHLIDRDELVFDPIVVSRDTSDSVAVMRVWLDRLWNAAGHSKCPLFKDGSDYADFERLKRS